MKTFSPYDTLVGKDRATVTRELEQLIGAARIALAQGSQRLIGQRAPYGPVMRGRDISFVYKCIWGEYAATLPQVFRHAKKLGLGTRLGG